MNLQAFALDLEAKHLGGNNFTARETYKFYMIREFINYCVYHKIYEIENVSYKFFEDYAIFYADKDISIEAITGKIMMIKEFLDENGCKAKFDKNNQTVNFTY